MTEPAPDRADSVAAAPAAQQSPVALNPLDRSPCAPRTLQLALSLIVLSVAALGLGWGLGVQPLWCDEADTALVAQGVWQTGDTSIEYGQNRYAYRGGMMLTGLYNRYSPPAQFYLLAPFWPWGQDDPFWLRLPFAYCAWAGIALMVAWLWKSQASTTTWLLMSLALTLNVSYLLHGRQCRYFALATLATLLVAWLYLRGEPSWRRLVALCAAAILLMATHYLNYLALGVVGAVDYLVWRRRERAFTWPQLLTFAATQAIAAAGLLSIWNPVGRDPLSMFHSDHPLRDKLMLIVWSFRDLNACEFAPGLLLLLVPLVYSYVRDTWLLRGLVALVVYVVTTALASPQPMALTSVADVRYLVPIIPLGMFLAVRTLRAMTWRVPWLGVALGVVVFGTNILHAPRDHRQWRSTPLEFIAELRNPPPSPIRPTAEWLRTHLQEGDTVWVAPDFSGLDRFPDKMRHLLVHPNTYALMVHAPEQLYAWQLSNPPPKQFADWPVVHISGRHPVEAIVAFGPRCIEMADGVVAEYRHSGIRYEKVATLDVCFVDRTRPELFWHAFRRPYYNRYDEVVVVYRRIDSGPTVP